MGLTFKATAATLMLTLLAVNALGHPDMLTALFSDGRPASLERPDLVELPSGSFT
jgi:hypothetical protein